MKLAAVLWDVDGTLAETERDGHLVAMNAAFDELGIPWRWSEQRYGELLRVAGGPTAPHRPPQRHPLACAGGGADAGRLWVGAAMGGPRRESEDSRTRVSQVSMAQIKL